MRRCKKGQQQGNLSTRRHLIIEQGRKLTPSTNRPWFNPGSHCRHTICVVPGYKIKSTTFKLKNYRAPGKTLRNKKHHIPKYKLERAELEWFMFYTKRSTNTRWHRNRVNWFKTQRDIKKVHIKYMDNNLQPHWWRV